MKLLKLSNSVKIIGSAGLLGLISYLQSDSLLSFASQEPGLWGAVVSGAITVLGFMLRSSIVKELQNGLSSIANNQESPVVPHRSGNNLHSGTRVPLKLVGKGQCDTVQTDRGSDCGKCSCEDKPENAGNAQPTEGEDQ